MRILILGSMKFVNDMGKVRKELGKLGHKVILPVGIKPHLKNSDFVENLDGNMAYCIKNDVMRRNFRLVAKSDAILVLNYKRNNMDGYIGISVLLEMGIAHYLKKKIFLMQKTPDYNKVRWAHEVAIMEPKVLDGDLAKIQ
ncbi:MAG: hypothetical protein HYU48_02685 [Candidatus Levybacteria bacterium]|nr:hypothetical protein [Candidatus Levybacteria bacterium]